MFSQYTDEAAVCYLAVYGSVVAKDVPIEEKLPLFWRVGQGRIMTYNGCACRQSDSRRDCLSIVDSICCSAKISGSQRRISKNGLDCGHDALCGFHMPQKFQHHRSWPYLTKLIVDALARSDFDVMVVVRQFVSVKPFVNSGAR